MKMALIITFALSPLLAHSAGNNHYHCRTRRAELVYHTGLHGEVAAGEYTVLNSQRSEFPKEAQRGGQQGISLVFFNQNRIFRIVNPGAQTPLTFQLEAQFFGDSPTVLETGLCVEGGEQVGVDRRTREIEQQKAV